MLEPLTAHVTWIVLLAHSWSLHGLNKIVNRFLGALRAAVYGAHAAPCNGRACLAAAQALVRRAWTRRRNRGRPCAYRA
ncbi:hypothetical protein FDU21_01655 [Xanthomonas oryzae pv. oryzae]|nr:hypothetical protein FDU21_01655 [Xanthomonas oryzae pv. oryzae]